MEYWGGGVRGAGAVVGGDEIGSAGPWYCIESDFSGLGRREQYRTMGWDGIGVGNERCTNTRGRGYAY